VIVWSGECNGNLHRRSMCDVKVEGPNPIRTLHPPHALPWHRT
jgi:hypothetical protein